MLGLIERLLRLQEVYSFSHTNVFETICLDRQLHLQFLQHNTKQPLQYTHYLFSTCNLTSITISDKMDKTAVHQSYHRIISYCASAQRLSSKCCDSLRYHLYTIYVTCSDDMETLLASFLFGAINSFIAPQFSMGPALSVTDLLLRAPFMLLWCISNLFLFCLHNQNHPEAIVEDARNKPWRPLASGRLTPAEATRILYLTHPLCFVTALSFGGFVPCVMFTLFHIWYNEFGASSNGILKNVLNGIGITLFFAGPLEVATKNSIFAGHGQAAIWLLILAIAFASTSHTQDFRDIEGDAASGRKTIPLMIGSMNARVCVLLAVFGWTELASRFWQVGLAHRLLPYLAGSALVGNLFLDKSHKGDVRAWKLWSLWALSLFVLPL